MRIAVDIGGTFTDVTVFDERTGRVRLGKALSTPSNLVDGIMASVGKADASTASATSLVHGSTIVINAILERKGAKTALVTTRGFRDVYEIGRINRPESFNLAFRKHRPLVPRELIFEVPERMLADGTEERPLDEGAGHAVAEQLRERGVEAVSILFLHSYRSPGHEIRMRDLLREACPGLFVTASHELSGEYREYERTSTVAANAYVGPLVSTYLAELERRLSADGFRGDLLIMQSSGGLYDVETAHSQCVQMMESGPAGGVVGTMMLCEQFGLDNAISFDMGGTTAKACVIRRGSPDVSPDYFVGGYNEGLVIRIPVLDIQEVGTGGGSIAWIDQGGALHVGPESAGSTPGPVCYARGGTEPTITDAEVALGYLAPDSFLGGEIRLDRDGAIRAIRERVAKPLGLTFERAASGILAIGVTSMANAVRSVTTERGLDPRDFTLVAYGGGGPPHAAAVARELAIRRVIIPLSPAHFSALGMLMADRRRDFVRTHFHRLAEVSMAQFETLYRSIQDEGARALSADGEQLVFERAADMRYVGQEHAVAVPVPADVGSEAARTQLKQAFDTAHLKRFSHNAPDEPAEIVSLRVSAVGRVDKPVLPRLAEGGAEPRQVGASRGERMVIFEDAPEPVACQVYERLALLAGNRIEGPAIVEEPASTTVIRAGDHLEVNAFGHLVVEVGGP